MIHSHDKYHHRLNPSYLSLYDRYNNAADYMANPRNFRISHPEDFGSMRAPLDPERSEYLKWLENRYQDMPRSERMEMLNRFYEGRYNHERMKSTMGGSYLSPS